MKINFNRDKDDSKDDVFQSPEEKIKTNIGIEARIDNILNSSPSETKRVAENLEFMDNIQNKNIPKNKLLVNGFGVKTFDLHDIFKDMLWDRSIFVTDAIVNMCIETSIERMKKYIPKKTKASFQHWWLIILMIIGGVGVAILLIFLLPQLGNIKLF